MGKQYAIMRMTKIKTDKQFADAYNHNFRIYNVTNADLSRKHLNKEVIDLYGKTYKEVYEETVTRMSIIGANKRKIRKDAVRAVEFVLRYSYEADANIDQDKWIEENIKWLQEYFNPPGHKIHFIDPETGEEKEAETDNLVSVVVHNDEGVPHIHAMVVPIDDKGHLNCGYYFGGRGKMIGLQDSYAKAMAQFGLERGEYKSIATPEQVSRYMSNITKAAEAELPEVKEGETAEEYRERANETYQDEKLQHRNEIVKQNQENIRLRSEQLKRFEESHEDSWENKKKLRQIAKAIGSDEIGEAEIEEIRRLKEEKKALEDAVDAYPDETVKKTIRNTQRQNINRARKKRKKKRRSR